jgi:hypothetical protein
MPQGEHRLSIMNCINCLSRFILATAFTFMFPVVCRAQALPPVPHEIAKVEFQLGEKSYSLELVPQKGAELGEGEEGSGYCGNPDGSPEIHSECDLVLKDGQAELSRLTLGECQFVFRHEKWLVREITPLLILKRNGELPLISVSQYAGCNGNMYHLFWIEAARDRLTLRPLTITSFPYAIGRNELWAEPSEDAVQLILSPQTHKYEIWAKGYDNAGLFSFIAQYGEISPGQWQCIGLYTEAGGAYGAMKKKIYGK